MRRMFNPVRIAVFSLFTFSSFAVQAQTGTDAGCKPPISRKLWHDNIDKAQAAALKLGMGKGDNDDVSHFVNNALGKRLDALQCRIDRDSMGEQRKVGYLRGLERMLKNTVTEFKG